MHTHFNIRQPRHKVFVSYHHANDQAYREHFEALFSDHYDILDSQSVQIGDIDLYLNTDRIRQRIRDEYLRNSTVTVVLLGTETWKRKHVDWEIAASIRETKFNPRSGLIGIFLPSHPDFGNFKYNPANCPPRLVDNVKCGFAKLYNWNDTPGNVQQWIHDAYDRRKVITPDNSHPSYAKNRS